jgi:acyl dehydratase
LSEKRIKVGDEFYVLREIDLYRPIYFAGATGIFHPIYIDPLFGKLAGFGGNILHEYCLTSFVISALCEWGGKKSSIKSINIKFKGWANPGDIIKIEWTVKRVKGKEISVLFRVYVREKEIAKGNGVIIISR